MSLFVHMYEWAPSAPCRHIFCIVPSPNTIIIILSPSLFSTGYGPRSLIRSEYSFTFVLAPSAAFPRHQNLKVYSAKPSVAAVHGNEAYSASSFPWRVLPALIASPSGASRAFRHLSSAACASRASCGHTPAPIALSDISRPFAPLTPLSRLLACAAWCRLAHFGPFQIPPSSPTILRHFPISVLRVLLHPVIIVVIIIIIIIIIINLLPAAVSSSVNTEPS
ncbi:hypothetical protein BDN70DRAFT_937121 [Pholiota conissans]|uniref:Uncharacterized protein n=1 Tax=Pholiota conissans TaxID=109636 RepID=A0A9P5YSJ1_9AGAR|nr:hypothetical protein BDN70DRAFT_937121 [Pholiota conissans]